MFKFLFRSKAEPEPRPDSYLRKCDLTDAETAAMNHLGKAIPKLGGENLAHNFAAFITMGLRGCHHINEHGETIKKYSLYTPHGENGHHRSPKISFYYAPRPHTKPEDCPVHIVFMPAYLTKSAPVKNGDAFIPLIIRAPEDTIAITCPVTLEILAYAKQYKGPQRAPGMEP